MAVPRVVSTRLAATCYQVMKPSTKWAGTTDCRARATKGSQYAGMMEPAGTAHNTACHDMDRRWAGRERLTTPVVAVTVRSASRIQAAWGSAVRGSSDRTKRERMIHTC